MENISIPSWVGKVLYGVGIAALLGTGSTVIQNAKSVAVLESQQERIERALDRLEGKIDILVEKSHAHPTP